MANVQAPKKPTPIVAIVGGAVAGSEAAALCARRGALAVVFEQGARPYGKIEDGLPRWHEKLRDQEYEKIDENLATPGVLFVPRTAVGRDVALGTLLDELGFSAVVLANGAWRDRPLPIDGIDAYLGKGLVYQNPFVQWFNHAHEPSYAGPRFSAEPGAIVVGGGLASIDVVKILNLQLYAEGLRARGIDVDVVEMEMAGIPETLKKHGLAPEDLGIRGATLYYRRRKQDMPLAAAAGDAPAQIAKAETARVKIMERVERKYLVGFEGLVSPVAPLVEGDRLVGLRFVRNEPSERGVQPVPGTELEVRAPLVVSSIGSVPLSLPGVPSKGELYDYEDAATGRIRGVPRLFGLGNVLTGKGNIRDSRENATEIAQYVVERFLGVAEPRSGAEPEPEPVLRARENAAAVVDAVLGGEPVSPARAERIVDFVRARWDAVGYGGDYASYAEAQKLG